MGVEGLKEVMHLAQGHRAWSTKVKIGTQASDSRSSALPTGPGTSHLAVSQIAWLCKHTKPHFL